MQLKQRLLLPNPLDVDRLNDDPYNPTYSMVSHDHDHALHMLDRTAQLFGLSAVSKTFVFMHVPSARPRTLLH